MAIDIRHLLDGSLQAMVADTLGQLPALNTRLNEAVSREIVEFIHHHVVTGRIADVLAKIERHHAVVFVIAVDARTGGKAITLRELAPFDKRLGTTQQAYEKAFAGVVNRILDEGYLQCRKLA